MALKAGRGQRGRRGDYVLDEARGPHRFSREKLHELVWSEPIARLAERLGVSGRGLAKACARAGIPVPGRGYWAKLQHGKRVRRLPLPPPKAGGTNVVEITPGPRRTDPPELPPGVQEQVAMELAPERRIVVPKSLSNAHRIVRAWLEHERHKKSAVSWQLDGTAPSSRRMTEPERRRVCILSAFFKALEQRGHKVIADPQSIYKVWAVVAEEKIEFTLTQRQRQVKVELSPAERRDPQNILVGRTQRVEQRLTDELVFRIRPTWWTDPRVRTVWADAPSKPLEDQLNAIVAAFVAASAVQREYRLKRAEQKQHWREQELERLGRQEAERAAARRFQELLEQITRWRQANDIRAFVDAVKAGAASHSQSRLSGLEEWALWALEHADRIDPLTSGHGFGGDSELGIENESTHGTRSEARVPSGRTGTRRDEGGTRP